VWLRPQGALNNNNKKIINLTEEWHGEVVEKNMGGKESHSTQVAELSCHPSI